MPNILLDYLFPITSIEPTPAASTAFLKQVCVIGKPKDGGVTAGVFHLITSAASASTYFGSAASAEVQKLFDAGLSRAYLLPMNDLDLASTLEGHESDFFTILITTDFGNSDITNSGNVVNEVKSFIKIQDILYTSKLTGTAGDDITVTYVDDGTAGSETVGVASHDITVHMQDGVSTAAQIATAIGNYSPANALVVTAVDAGDESDSQSAVTAQTLGDGVDAVVGDGLDVGAFVGVVGVSSTDGSFLTAQAAMANRSAWHTTSSNKAKNMFFAFGKMLSNSLNWRNQQYISMPLADDVDTLGEANSYFDDKVNFVLSDDEFSNRLGLFVAGGKAIVAPYIKRNLQIDMQSKALSYIAGNQPGYTKTQAALLEDELQKVIDGYIDIDWISAGVVEVELLEDNFVASGNINIAEPKALWRIFAEMTATL